MGGPRERTDDEGLIQTHGVESDGVCSASKQREAWQGRAGQLNAHQPKRRVKRAWLNLVSASSTGAAWRILQREKSDQRAVPVYAWMALDLTFVQEQDLRSRAIRGNDVHNLGVKAVVACQLSVILVLRWGTK